MRPSGAVPPDRSRAPARLAGSAGGPAAGRRRRLAAWLLPLLLAPLASAQSGPGGDDVILRAMRDELDRSRQLRVVGADNPPYFISYSLTDADSFTVSAVLGALMSANHNRFRVPLIEVRIGSYDFDNTGHIFTGFYSGARYDPDHWPLDDNYAFFRHCLWLATDRAYKAAVESMGRKQASLKNAQPVERLPDFSKAEPVEAVLKIPRKRLDEAYWTNRVVKLSAILNTYPEVLVSAVEMQAAQGATYLANSEGTTIRYPDSVSYLRAKAEAQAPDGMLVRDAASFQSFDPDKLPPDVEIRRALTDMADNVRALLKAPLGETYSGPVLFEATAAAQLFAQLLGDNLRVPRKPLAEPGRPLPFLPSEFEAKLGSRILPEWIDVVDDPTQAEWHGHALLGHYTFDMEGVPPKPVSVVEKGVLKNILTTRQPVKSQPGSNGHARLPGSFGVRGAAIGNLFIRAAQTVPDSQVKQKLIELCRERSKPYGILVRKLDYPSAATVREVQTLASQSGGNRPLSLPVLIYRVYPDGREEMIRGLRFRGVTSRSLRDILAASDGSVAFDFINNAAPLALMSAGGYLAPATVIAPAILFDELELERPQDQLPKPPVVPPPPLAP